MPGREMAERQNAAPIVLLHALGVDASMWDSTREALEDLGHTVLAPDLRGFGSAPLGEEPPSLDVSVDDLTRLLGRHGIDRAVIAGCSMGGYVAMGFLARHRHRVQALALLSTRARADEPAEKDAREMFATLMAAPDRAADVIAAASLKLVGATTRAEHPDVFERVRALAAKSAPASLAWAQRAIAARPDSTAVLRTATVPALVLAGTEDEMISADDHRHVADALPNARLGWLDDVGHLPPMEAPDQVAAELHRLIDEAR